MMILILDLLKVTSVLTRPQTLPFVRAHRVIRTAGAQEPRRGRGAAEKREEDEEHPVWIRTGLDWTRRR